jgi:fluoroacetyl-CoA thioesterase
MKHKPRPGLTGTVQFVVDASHLITFAGRGMPGVLATPHLVHFLEMAAREVLQPLLEEGENSVGMEIEVRHLAPTPPGHTVTCTARVVHVDGEVVDFQVEAADELEPIARGLHQRAVIRVDRFARRVAKKQKS